MSEMVAQDRLLDRLGLAEAGWDGVLAIFTYCVRWTTADEVDFGQIGNLLEVRAYNKDAVAHAVRTVLGVDFAFRLADDRAAGLQEDEYLDELQYLDVDATRSGGFGYVTTGGGAYRLPVADATKILIRNYVRYDERDGMAHIVDFRIMGLE